MVLRNCRGNENAANDLIAIRLPLAASYFLNTAAPPAAIPVCAEAPTKLKKETAKLQGLKFRAASCPESKENRLVVLVLSEGGFS